MRAQIRSMRSPDADLENHVLDDAEDFGLLIEIDVGSVGEFGDDTFQVMVCTPKWLAAQVHEHGPLTGRHYVIVEKYHFPTIRDFLTSKIESEEAPTWDELAERIGRIGKWEFEDYRE